MKKFFTIVLAALIAVSAFAAAPKDTLRILAIGNSFSVNAVEHNLHAIADADGICLIIGNMYIGGCFVERHYLNARADSPDYSYRKINKNNVRTVKKEFTISQALADEPWDIVTFQQASHFAGFPETYEPYLTDLIAYVRERVAPGTQFWWHQTWAYAQSTKHKAFPNYGSDQGNMYSLIVNVSSKVCKEHSLKVIPCGTAIQNLRGTFVGDNVTISDGFHLNNLGCYTAACTWYQAICGQSVVGNAFRPQYISEEEVVAAQKSAAAAVKKPFKVSSVK